MDTLFFWASKLIWLLISPDTLFLILFILAWGLFICKKIESAKKLMTFLVIVLLIVALFPVGEWILYPLEKRMTTNPKLPDKVDGVIVLGGSTANMRSVSWDQVELNESAERNFAFISLSKKYPEAKLVFTGGSGSLTNQELKEATLMRRLFEEQGLDLSRIIFEDASRNTYENAIFTMKKVKPHISEKWILITSAAHMPRSVGIFCKAGWPVLPYPVDHLSVPGNLFRIELNLSKHLMKLKKGMREWTGLVAYRLSGKTSSFFPDGCE